MVAPYQCGGFQGPDEEKAKDRDSKWRSFWRKQLRRYKAMLGECRGTMKQRSRRMMSLLDELVVLFPLPALARGVLARGRIFRGPVCGGLRRRDSARQDSVLRETCTWESAAHQGQRE